LFVYLLLCYYPLLLVLLNMSVEYLPARDGASMRVVVIKYESLVKGEDLSESIEAAFGYDGLGLLAVSGVPQVSEIRQNFLPYGKKIADLPDDKKAKMEDPSSFYSVGWSHGKEKMSEGKFDFAKGSFYANPLHDRPVDDEETIKKYPAFCAPNIWPKEDLPGLEFAFKEAGKLVVDVGLLVAKQCDELVHKKCPNYPTTKLFDIITKCRTPKARLLHYFPIEQTEFVEGDFSSWCGWHNDHGSLTGLIPAMYLDKEGKVVAPPSSEAGLYAMARNGTVVHAAVPADHLTFQIGEAACIHSGGVLQV